MKKNITLLILILLVLCFSSVSIIAYADETVQVPADDTVPDTETPEEKIELKGAKLPEEYSVRLGFSYLQPANGGVFLKFDLIFSEDFLNEDNLEEAEKSVEAIVEYFKNTRYKTEKTESGISATASFSSPTDYYLAIGASGFDKPSKDESVYHYNWFFVDIETPVKNPLKDSEIISDLEEKIFALNAEKTQYVYTYSTRYKIIKTDGVLTKEGDTFIHTFYMDKDSMPDTFTFVQRTPNTSGWYIIALLGAFIIGIIITAIGMSKYGKKHK